MPNHITSEIVGALIFFPLLVLLALSIWKARRHIHDPKAHDNR